MCYKWGPLEATCERLYRLWSILNTDSRLKLELVLLITHSGPLYIVVVHLLSCIQLFVWPHGLQHTRLSCPSSSLGIHSNSSPLNWWCHSSISSSVTPFSSCPQSFPASGSFPVSWLFTSGGQCIGASTSVLPMNIEGWLPLGLTGLITLLSKGLSRVFHSTTVWKHQFFSTQPSCLLYGPTLTFVHDYRKNHSFDYGSALLTFISKVMSLLFYMVSRFVTVSSHI